MANAMRKMAEYLGLVDGGEIGLFQRRLQVQQAGDNLAVLGVRVHVAERGVAVGGVVVLVQLAQAHPSVQAESNAGYA